jgi:NitT/TauT family transport system ATP-binding protein
MSQVQVAGPAGSVSEGAAISISGMSVAYPLAKGQSGGRGGETLALDNVSLHITPGEFVAIVGPSGCGKSTLLKAVAGLLPPTQGSYSVSQPGVIDPRVGFVFQADALLPWLTSVANVELAARLSGPRPGKDEESTHERARGLMRDLGLGDCCDMYPGQLSGGMRKRVAIARALAYRPAAFLMDEPFGPLDAITRGQVGNFFLRIIEQASQTTLFVTHDIDEAVSLADRVTVLSARPGRHIATIDIPLPRPRDYHESRLLNGFGDLRRQVAAALGLGGA